MPLSAPRIFFGVHTVTPYNRTTGEFYGTCKVLGGSSLALSGELIKLNGGSAKYPWAVEDGLISAEMSLKVKEYPDFLFELFLGKAPTASSADTSGTVSTLTNKYGTTLMNASTGIASVAVLTASSANLKFGKYVIKAASATTFDIYVSSDVDFARGTDVDYESDLLKVTASPLSITSGSNTDVADLGLRFAGGSGTIAVTSGHTATFEVKPISDKSMAVTIGSSVDTFPAFGTLVVAKKRGNQEMMEVDCFNCKGVGLPLNFEENAFSEAEIKIEAFYDAARDGVFSIRHISPT